MEFQPTIAVDEKKDAKANAAWKVLQELVSIRIVLVARASITHQDTAPGSWIFRFQTTGTALGAAGSLSRIPVHVLPA